MLFIVDDSERTTSLQKTSSELPDKRIYFSQFD